MVCKDLTYVHFYMRTILQYSEENHEVFRFQPARPFRAERHLRCNTRSTKKTTHLSRSKKGRYIGRAKVIEGRNSSKHTGYLEGRGEVLSEGEREEAEDRHGRLHHDELQRGLLGQAEEGAVPTNAGQAAQRERVRNLHIHTKYVCVCVFIMYAHCTRSICETCKQASINKHAMGQDRTGQVRSLISLVGCWSPAHARRTAHNAPNCTERHKHDTAACLLSVLFIAVRLVCEDLQAKPNEQASQN